jgi:hypothetical protein
MKTRLPCENRAVRLRASRDLFPAVWQKAGALRNLLNRGGLPMATIRVSWPVHPGWSGFFLLSLELF